VLHRGFIAFKIKSTKVKMRRLTYDELKGGQYIFSYDIVKYDFEGIIKKIFNHWDGPLSSIHIHSEETIHLIDQANDTKTLFHRKFYDSPHYDEFIELYYRFVKEVVLPIFDCTDSEFVVQKDAAFRVNLPNGSALGFCPNDSDGKIGFHCDADYNHQPGEINFILTLSGQSGNNSCYIETSPGSNDYNAADINYGQFISFYGNKCRHYNKVNDTGVSRLSIDFRVMPMSKYDPTYSLKSVTKEKRFVIGDYYTVILSVENPPS
jgi:hypothetical protein